MIRAHVIKWMSQRPFDTKESIEEAGSFLELQGRLEHDKCANEFYDYKIDKWWKVVTDMDDAIEQVEEFIERIDEDKCNCAGHCHCDEDDNIQITSVEVCDCLSSIATILDVIHDSLNSLVGKLEDIDDTLRGD